MRRRHLTAVGRQQRVLLIDDHALFVEALMLTLTKDTPAIELIDAILAKRAPAKVTQFPQQRHEARVS